MAKILILVEGQTEETFVRDILDPHLKNASIYVIPKILVTKTLKSGNQFKGGIRSYEQVKHDLQRLLNDTSAAMVTTMLDYYGLPEDFPGFADIPPGPDPYAKVEHLERQLARDMADLRFLPYLALHEYEALIFTNPECCQWIYEDESVVRQLAQVRDAHATPEHINNHRDTAPSKRVLQAFPSYQKPLHGPLATAQIGLPVLRAACHHFGKWLASMEAVK